MESWWSRTVVESLKCFYCCSLVPLMCFKCNFIHKFTPICIVNEFLQLEVADQVFRRNKNWFYVFALAWYHIASFINSASSHKLNLWIPFKCEYKRSDCEYQWNCFLIRMWICFFLLWMKSYLNLRPFIHFFSYRFESARTISCFSHHVGSCLSCFSFEDAFSLNSSLKS